jgi:hypothetical protein
MTAVRQSLLAALLATALTACAQLPPSDNSARPGAAAETGTGPARDDPSSRFIGVIGSRAQHAAPFLGVPGTNFYCLRSFVDRQTGDTQHQLYVSDSYSGAEQQWNAARDGAGRPLRFIEIGRSEITCQGGCSYLDEFAAVIPESELRGSPQGLKITFFDRSGAEKTIGLSASQITAQLAAVEARRDSVQPAAELGAPPVGSHQ